MGCTSSKATRETVKLDFHSVGLPAVAFSIETLVLIEANQAFRSNFDLKKGDSFVDVFCEPSVVDKVIEAIKESGQFHGSVNCKCDGNVDAQHSNMLLSKTLIKSPSMELTLDLPKLKVLDTMPKTSGVLYDMVCYNVDKCCVALFWNIQKYRYLQTSLYTMLYYHHNVIKSMYPKHVTDVIVNNDHKRINTISALGMRHKMVTVCFIDIVGFTELCGTMDSTMVMQFLNEYFSCLDKELNKFNIFRYETVGDCYVCVSGLGRYNKKSGQFECYDNMNAATSAINMLSFIKRVFTLSRTKMLGGKPLRVRVGGHSGDVSSGIIDNAMPKYSMFGDTMNVASRMESTSLPGHLQVSATTYDLLSSFGNNYVLGFLPRTVNVKGKGTMNTYLLDGSKVSSSQDQVRFSDSITGNLENFLNMVRFTNTTINHIEKEAHGKSFEMLYKGSFTTLSDASSKPEPQ